jgi:hypothetical protein
MKKNKTLQPTTRGLAAFSKTLVFEQIWFLQFARQSAPGG